VVIGCSSSEVAELPEAGGSAPDAAPPNIVLYVSDTLRADALDAAFTPNLDRLAAEGTRYDHAFAPTSWTRPSITSILTGLRPESHGVEGPFDVLEPAHASLPELLKARGYTTGAIVANPNVGSFYGYASGFDEFIELYARTDRGAVQGEEMIARAEEISERAVEWIDGAAEPWMLFVLSVDPHAPYTPPPPFDRPARKIASPVWGTNRDIFRKDLDATDRQKVRAFYDGEVAYQDFALKPLLSHLERDGSIEHTLFVFTSDHGEEFWEHGRLGHGYSLSEEVLRVPLIVRDPRDDTRGEISNAPVEVIDIVPTLLEAAGIRVPEGLDGQPLDSPNPERITFSSLNFKNQRFAATARRGPWKLEWSAISGRRALFHAADVGEHRDRAAEHPEIVDVLFAALEANLKDSERRRELAFGDRQHVDGPLPPNVRDALEALGYIDAATGDTR
jgi:arylsulfatase A-like enzyme